MLKNECSRNCWLAAAVVGLLVWIFNWTFFGGLILGLIAFFLLGKTLIWLVCEGGGSKPEDAALLEGRTAAEPAGDTVLDRAEQAVVDASNAFAAGTVAAVAKGREAIQDIREEAQKRAEKDDRDDDDDDDDDDRRKSDDDDDDDDDSILERAEERLEKAGEAVKDAMGALAARGKEAISSLTNRQDDDRPAAYEAPVSLASSVSPGGRSVVPTDPQDAKPKAKHHAPAKPEAEAKPAAEPAAKAKPAAKPVAEAKPEVQPKPKADPKPATAKPAAKKAKPAAKADDLKEIKGVGPALEALLHENGVTSFTQIAGWTDTEIDHYAELIGRMGGRIRSDDWVAQAKVLAEGGSTEFSRRVDKGEVY